MGGLRDKLVQGGPLEFSGRLDGFSGASAASGLAWFLARRAQGYLTKQDLTSLFLQPESVCEMVLEGWDLVEFDDPGVVYQSV